MTHRRDPEGRGRPSHSYELAPSVEMLFPKRSEPRLAQQVTAELTELFISENLKVRQQESEGTTDFLEKQLEDARESLSEQEAKVTGVRKRARRGFADAGSEQPSDPGWSAIATSKRRRCSEYREAAAGLSPGSAGARTECAKPMPAGWRREATHRRQPIWRRVDAQLEKLRAQLADLSSRYTDQLSRCAKHRRTRSPRAGSGQGQPRCGIEGRARKPKQPADNSGAIDPTLTGPALQTQSQLQANQLEIQNRESAIASLKARINDYQGRLNAEPATEQELADLTRGYDQSKANYDDLLKKKDESAMATSMEADAARRAVHHARSSQFAVKAGLPKPAQILRHSAWGSAWLWDSS